MTQAALQTLRPIRHATLGDLAFERISELLMTGQVAPGDRLSMRHLAEALDVSMMPVREAVSRLAAMGALEVTRNRAVAAPTMDAARFRDLTRVRIEVEGYAAAEAARARDDVALARIAMAEAAFRDESRRPAPDLAEAVRLNHALHFAIYDAAGSETLTEIVRVLWLKVGPVLNLDLRENAERISTGGAVRFHAEAVAAIAAGDAKAASAAIAADIAGAAEFILSRGRLKTAV